MRGSEVFLFKYIWNVFQISGRNGVDINKGLWMFVSNLKNYRVNMISFFEGADSLNYDEVLKKWSIFSDEQKEICYQRAEGLLECKYEELKSCYKQKDQKTFNEIIRDYKNRKEMEG